MKVRYWRTFFYYFDSMTIKLGNDQSINIRQFKSSDILPLYAYLQNLSQETRSRFGPHPFDWEYVKAIAPEKKEVTKRFIAISADTQEVVAYLLIQIGLVKEDLERYKRRGQLIKPESSASFAPSVTDQWQGTGLGIVLTKYVETISFDLGVRELVLWGGVQATNEKALRFYEKLGYRPMGKFYSEGKENIDMKKSLL